VAKRAIVATVAWLAGALLVWLQLPAGAWDVFWAEDGRTFVGAWLRDPSVGLVFTDYAGYLHVVPRLLTLLVTALLPVSWWAGGVAWVACLAVSGIALLTFVLSRDVVAGDPARVGLALIPLLIPMARLEAIGNVANLHWYLFYLMPWLLLAVPRTRAGAVGLAVVSAAAVLTEPQCLLFLPLVVFVLLRDRRWAHRDRRWAVPVGWAVGGVGQVLTMLTHGQRHADLADTWSAVLGYAANAAGTTVLPSGGRLAEVVSHLGWWPLLLLTGSVVALAGLAWAWGRYEIRVAVVTVALGSMATWAASYFLNDHADYLYGTEGGRPLVPLVRWGTAAAMLLAAIVPLAADVLLGLGGRYRVAGWIVLIGLIVVMLFWFRRADSNRSGADWQTGLDDARQACTVHPGRPVSIATAPEGWTVRMACADLD